MISVQANLVIDFGKVPCIYLVFFLSLLTIQSAFALQVLHSPIHTLVAVITLQGATTSSGPLIIHTLLH